MSQLQEYMSQMVALHCRESLAEAMADSQGKRIGTSDL